MTRTCIASRATATSTASQVVDGVAKLAAGYRYVEGNGRREVIRTLHLLALASLLAGCASLGGLPAPGERDFARIQDGMTRDDTRRLLGAPFESMRFPLSGNESWDYRYQDTWGYLAAFSVIFGPQGTVVGHVTQRLNDGGDHGK